jgi:general stress protein YciG
MPGTRAGGLKAAKKNKKNYGKDFYKIIGSKGGHNGHTGGFAADHERAREAGRKGGLRSRRTGVANGEGKRWKKERIWKGDSDDELVFA